VTEQPFTMPTVEQFEEKEDSEQGLDVATDAVVNRFPPQFSIRATYELGGQAGPVEMTVDLPASIEIDVVMRVVEALATIPHPPQEDEERLIVRHS
jgi:hypothetical protein